MFKKSHKKNKDSQYIIDKYIQILNKYIAG